MNAQMWLLINTTIAILTFGSVVLLVKTYLVKRDRLVLYLASILFGPSQFCGSMVLAMYIYPEGIRWTGCLDPGFLRMRTYSLVAMMLLVMIGSFGIFFLNGDRK